MKPGLTRKILSLALALCCAPLPAQDDVRFDIARFRVEGNTLLSAGRVEELVAPFAGARRVYGDIQQALEALENAYRQAGYGTVQVHVPEQELEGGVVRLVVSEAVIGKVAIDGNRHFDADNIRAALPALREGHAPNMRELSEAVQLANENPARQVELTLAVAEEEGRVDARIKVADENPRRFIVTLDNTGTDGTGRHRLGLALQHANLFERDHVATVSYAGAPDMPKNREVGIFSAAYRLPLYGIGDAIDAVYGRSTVNSPNPLATVATGGTVANIVGKGDILALRWNHYLPRRGEYAGKLIFGYDHKKIETQVGACGGAVACSPPLLLQPLSVAYAGQAQRPGEAYDYNVSLAGAGQPKFAALRGSLAWLSALPDDWMLRLGFNAQYSGDALPDAEKFGVAGATAVRGFFERMVTGDQGYALNLELHGPEMGRIIGPDAGSLRFLGFIDHGQSRSRATPGTTEIASVGLGLRYALDKRVALRGDVAYVIKAGATGLLAPTPDTNVRENDLRGHFALQVVF